MHRCVPSPLVTVVLGIAGSAAACCCCCCCSCGAPGNTLPPWLAPGRPSFVGTAPTRSCRASLNQLRACACAAPSADAFMQARAPWAGWRFWPLADCGPYTCLPLQDKGGLAWVKVPHRYGALKALELGLQALVLARFLLQTGIHLCKLLHYEPVLLLNLLSPRQQLCIQVLHLLGLQNS